MNEKYRRGYEAGKRGDHIARFRDELRRMNPKDASQFTKGYMEGQKERQK